MITQLEILHVFCTMMKPYLTYSDCIGANKNLFGIIFNDDVKGASIFKDWQNKLKARWLLQMSVLDRVTFINFIMPFDFPEWKPEYEFLITFIRFSDLVMISDAEYQERDKMEPSLGNWIDYYLWANDEKQNNIVNMINDLKNGKSENISATSIL